MNFETFLLTVQMRCAKLPEGQQLVHARLGMITELGEIADLIKRELAYGKEFDRIHLLEECGDFLWYFALYCHEHYIAMNLLDKLAAKALKLASKQIVESDSKICEALALATLMLAGEALTDSTAQDRLDAAEGCLLIVLAFLLKYSFTLKQCLAANDAKLEKRTGKVFNAAAILNRDTDAERKILEDHGTPQSDQGPR